MALAYTAFLLFFLKDLTSRERIEMLAPLVGTCILACRMLLKARRPPDPRRGFPVSLNDDDEAEGGVKGRS